MIIIISLIWFISFFDVRSKKIKKDVVLIIKNDEIKNDLFLNLMVCIQLIPIVIALLVPSYRGNFLSYGARYTMSNVAEIPAFILGIGSVAFVFYLLHIDNKRRIRNIFSIVLAFLTVYLRGSRAIIANMMVMSMYAFLLSDKIEFKKLFKIILFLVPFCFLLFYLYHLLFRNSSESFYSYYSIDFSRDYTTIFSIYAQTHGIEVLEYAGQSILFCLLFWIPRRIFEGKPFPFPTYMTLALLGTPIKYAKNLTMRTTTNIFSEGISNFGIVLGTLFIVIVILIVLRVIDSTKSISFKFLWIYIGFDILVLDFANWIYPVLFMLLVFVIFDYIYDRKVEKKLV